ncbi:glutamine-hydrolyzing carbamoyl-phosphate synthase small subunit [Planctomyces sp. SH-PL62]|uniref:glutamine-hydrolyzing carbamoyl-phosphate synthase small subunit n=1 Tax=Planctomyces sp. SH-PL62 TaxID=1636152 RepID=UPI00078CC5E2|nr:glutamine-hydrolyzing carbamoyl-phosphate synthase small subunit [Planctomyces sp. SH-PL62]AMV36719.1 Carbamoyl-phosphate synthase small chain [Planctomyces sp. SH-PL62]
MGTAKLALEDGSVFTGRSFGAQGEIEGEVVFNTSMTGYQEILTDPSYHGQIVAMTYPEIGNYGVNTEDAESRRPWVRGFVVRELSSRVSNFRAEKSLAAYLEENGVVGVSGIDTRALVRLTRVQGALRGILSTADLDDASLVAKARKSPGMVGRALASEVMPSEAKVWDSGLDQDYQFDASGRGGSEVRRRADGAKRPHVVAMDFGMKWSIPRHLVDIGCRVTVVPGSASAEAVMEHQPDGVFLSNGPGDPRPLVEATNVLKTLIRTAAESRGIPIFGICLGHQLLGQAFGADTFKLRFGHRGANHPVRNEATGKIEITVQNHGFAVDPSTLPADVVASHVNLNDQTLEGLRHTRLPVFGVQYHPEAAAGPHDSQYLFDEFRTAMA